jgi:hypothetical protein
MVPWLLARFSLHAEHPIVAPPIGEQDMPGVEGYARRLSIVAGS